LKYIKKFKILIFLLACFIVGFITMPLFHNGYVGALINTFTYVAWYWHLLIVLGVLFFTLALHELTHFLTSILTGYKNDMMIIFMFLFYKDKGKWRFKISPKLLLLGGGLVWPNLGEIHNETDYINARKSIQTSLLAAPLVTLISGILPLLLALLFFYKTFLIPISLYIFLFSMLYTYVSTLESGEIVGDFKAYKRIKHNDDFSNLVILQYSETTPYQYEYLKNYLQTHSTYNKQTRMYLSYLLDKNIFKDNEIDLFLYEKVLSIISYEYEFKNFLRHDEGIILAQHIILFLYKAHHQDDALSFYEIFEDSILKKKTKDIYKQYLLRQTKHLLNLSDESGYINDKKNMQINALSFILNTMPSIVENELEKNEGFEKFPIQCNIENGLDKT